MYQSVIILHYRKGLLSVSGDWQSVLVMLFVIPGGTMSTRSPTRRERHALSAAADTSGVTRRTPGGCVGVRNFIVYVYYILTEGADTMLLFLTSIQMLYTLILSF